MAYPSDTSTLHANRAKPRQSQRPTGAKTTSAYAALETLPPQDRLSEVILTVVRESRSELVGLAFAHEEAILNSLCASPTDNYVTAQRPYGTSLWGTTYEDRVISNIISPFTSEQVSAITTRLVTPLLGQREILYVEPQGSEDILKARVRERLFERAIRSPYTNWAALVWQTMRDVVVRSRGYMEVRHLLRVKNRRQYIHETLADVEMSQGLPEGELQQTAMEAGISGNVRLSEMRPVTLWDGPVIRALPFGTVHKPKNEPFISEVTPYVVIERTMPYKEMAAEAARMFNPKAESVIIPWDEAAYAAATGERPAAPGDSYLNSNLQGTGERVGMRFQFEADPMSKLPSLYEPLTILEFRGQDPLGDPKDDILAWSAGGKCIGAKKWDGSGSPVNIVEWVWDPMNGFTTSASPAMVLRRMQEMLNLMWSSRLDQVMWQGHPAGLIDPMVVDVEIARKIRPGRFGEKRGEGNAVEWFQVGRNSGEASDLIDRTEAAGRLATGGTAAVVGQAPAGVSTATEFAGVSKGAFDRIGAQQEINAENVSRLFRLVTDSWRDGLPTDEALADILGQNVDTNGATLADLDGDLDVIPMAARYAATNSRELDAIKSVKEMAMGDPALLARLKPEMDDDLVQAAAGPRGRRWVKSNDELMAEGMDPAQLTQMRIQGAQAQSASGKGTPSPPANVAESAADNMPQG